MPMACLPGQGKKKESVRHCGQTKGTAKWMQLACHPVKQFTYTVTCDQINEERRKREEYGSTAARGKQSESAKSSDTLLLIMDEGRHTVLCFRPFN